MSVWLSLLHPLSTTLPFMAATLPFMVTVLPFMVCVLSGECEVCVCVIACVHMQRREHWGGGGRGSSTAELLGWHSNVRGQQEGQRRLLCR